jgi:pimeloyl-ACP methyl ester carboxylesterase
LLEELTVPTLVLVGDDDCLVSASAAEEIAGRIPMGRSRIIRGAGHLPFLEATDEFERLVDELSARSKHWGDSMSIDRNCLGARSSGNDVA